MKKTTTKKDLADYADVPNLNPAFPARVAMQYLGGISDREFRRLVATRQIAVVRRTSPSGRGGHVKVLKAELDRYLKANTIPAARREAANA